MTAITATRSQGFALPKVSVETIALVLVGGAAGTVAFDLFGKAVSPMFGFATLSPDGLARAFLGALGLPNGAAHGQFMHLFLIGLLAYPIGWLFVARPAFRRFAPGLGWPIASAIYGFGLWVFAIGGITTFAGLPTFLNFTGITWVALIGHVIYGLAAAAAIAYVEKLQTR